MSSEDAGGRCKGRTEESRHWRACVSESSSDKLTYSDSVDERATVRCFCDFHSTPANINTYPEYDRRSSRQPPNQHHNNQS
ncbi:hypothetical protein EVAR_16901_1 [Eumeta japonica]|uniref:Uncharacterized protein n=1 Tax=Eumeta variegata TaxID=151549 RepID=A0A4C1TVB4_EUMVA|nr:hypothetical protein EVAR_16901_1 [Eumeta japonica]